jgi:tetratricopeptide (TPR) repeat protein
LAKHRLASRYRAMADELAWRRAVNRGRSNRTWEWIVGAVFVVAIILTGYRLVQTQQHLETRQSELENANQATDRAKAQATELAKRVASLNSELEKANSRTNELQSKLEQATSENTSGQSQLEDNQPGLGDMQSELENAKQAADQAKAQGTELAKRAASLNSELERANAQLYVVDPGNPRNQSNLAASYVKVGDFLMAQGDLAQALKWYRDGLAVGLAGADRLVKSDPENGVWPHNLSLYSRVGDVLMAQGNLADALKSYQDGLAAADRLAKLDPENAGWSRDVSIASKKIGEAIAASCPRTSPLSITVSRSWSRQVPLSPCP